MTTIDIVASFGPGAADRESLSRAHRATLDALFQHPLAHGLEWMDIVALMKTIGEIENHPDGETCFAVAGERKLFRKPHTKDVPATMLIDFRHMLTRAGWSPHAVEALPTARAAAEPGHDVLVVVERREARVYRLDVASGEEDNHLIRSDLSPHKLHELAHRTRTHDSDTGWKSDPAYYERIAQALQGGGGIVLAGHGHGHSNAAHDLEFYLRQHHATIASRLGMEIDVDLSSLTGAQRRALGRRALTASGPAAEA